MDDVEAIGRRRGGRAARREIRTAPTPPEKLAVHAGLEGGRYQALSERDVARIHAAALDVLEQVGVGDPIPSCVELVTGAGGRLSENGRLLFPRALVEDALARAARRFPLCGFDPCHDLEPWGAKVHFGTGGAA